MDQDVEAESVPTRRKRRQAALANRVTKRMAVEDEKIFFKFEGDKGKVHSVPWTELLTLEELPFSDSAGISVGTKVLAPWYCDAELTVRHAEAVVVEGRGKGVTPGKKKKGGKSPGRTPIKSPSKRPKTKNYVKKAREHASIASSRNLLEQISSTSSTLHDAAKSTPTPSTGVTTIPNNIVSSDAPIATTSMSENTGVTPISVTPTSHPSSSLLSSIPLTSSDVSSATIPISINTTATPTSHPSSNHLDSIPLTSSNISSATTPISINTTATPISVTPTSHPSSNLLGSIPLTSSDISSATTPISSISTTAASISVTPTSHPPSNHLDSISLTSSDVSSATTPISKNTTAAPIFVTPTSFPPSTTKTVTNEFVKSCPSAFHNLSLSTPDVTALSSNPFTPSSAESSVDIATCQSLSHPDYDFNPTSSYSPSDQESSLAAYESFNSPSSFFMGTEYEVSDYPDRDNDFIPPVSRSKSFSGGYGPSQYIRSRQPSPLLSRSFSAPPRHVLSYRNKVHSSDTEESDAASSFSSVSVYKPMVGSKAFNSGGSRSNDLDYVYSVWIIPLQQQLQRIENKFELLLSANTTSSGQCIVESVADERQPPTKSKGPSHLSKRPDPVPELTDNERPYLKAKGRVCDSANETEEEDSEAGGCYLGFSKSAKFRVWIPSEILSSSALKGIEQNSSSASELAMSLFTRLFKDDLERRPDDICATDNRLNGREVCNPEFMRGIRLHIARKYPDGKFEGPVEAKRWGEILKKLNGHIRYKRSKKKTK